jgi:16S rRNA (guanine966-N2)-methyltransferase
MQKDAVQWLKSKPAGPFDLVFIDPPFQAGLLDESLALLATSNSLAAGALIYIERDRNDDPPQLPTGWQVHKDKVAGSVSYALYRVDA